MKSKSSEKAESTHAAGKSRSPRSSKPKAKQPSLKPQTGNTRAAGYRAFAEAGETAPDLSKRTGSSQLSGEAATKLYKQSRSRARGQGKPEGIPSGKDKAAVSLYGSRTKVSVTRTAKNEKNRPSKKRE